MSASVALSAPEKTYAVKAVNAFVDEGTVESPTYDKNHQCTGGKAQGGSEISFWADESKGVFQNWTIKPASLSAQLSDEDLRSSKISFVMPCEAVTVTANMLAESKIGAWVCIGCNGSDEDSWTNTVGGAWSPDKGKTWIPSDYEYPLAAGTYTIKFRAPEGWVAPNDLTLVVAKPQSYTYEKEGPDGQMTKRTEYEAEWIKRNVLFYPQAETMLQTVKFDGNGGKPEVSQVSYPVSYVQLTGLWPLPIVQPRSGYAFDGWWTAKEGGRRIDANAPFDPMWLDPGTNALYAHWKKTYTLTFGGADMSAGARDEEERFPVVWGEGGKGTKLTVVGNGQFVYVSAPETIFNSTTKKELVFQKWSVTPSSAVLTGEDYNVQNYETQFLMPEANITLTPTYVDPAKCGELTAYIGSEWIDLGWDDELGDYRYLYADNMDMQWSPDGGKTWYNADAVAKLTSGKYTVQWRSASPMWQAPTGKTTVQVVAGEFSEAYGVGQFLFIPAVVVDFETSDGNVPTGCSVTMNPKDGRVLPGKALTLTAKDSKDYLFRVWRMESCRGYSQISEEKTWKPGSSSCSGGANAVRSMLLDFINPEDHKVHVTAAFKAIGDYKQEDLVENFFGVWGMTEPEVMPIDEQNVELTVQGMTGCDFWYEFDIGSEIYPITIKKTSGNLPKGVKFDAKYAEVSGVPTAKNGEKTTCVFTITDPAKNVLNVKVNFNIRPLRDGFAGDYRALLHELEWVEMEECPEDVHGNPVGLVEMSVTSAGKISAKVLHQGGSTSLSGTLCWYPDEDDPEAPGSFDFDLYDKKGNSIWGEFLDDGTVRFGWSVIITDGAEGFWFDGYDETAYRQDKDLYAMSAFCEKYYTFAFGTSNTVYECQWIDDPYAESGCGEKAIDGGYGYLTVKTDKKGVAKVSGKLPDGTAVSANALLLPEIRTGGEPTAADIWARLFFFNAPSAYKKAGWCALSLQLLPAGNGILSLDQGDPHAAIWVEPPAYSLPASACAEGVEPTEWQVTTAIGAFYSPAKTLENHYWGALCLADDRVKYQYQYKEDGLKWYEDASPMTFDSVFFAVVLAGDKKGAIALEEKSPAPWKDKYGKWNYYEDKNGNPITDPSQLSVSFAKATGIFSGKTNLYFDYYDGSKVQHQKVSVPYAGVMIDASFASQGILGMGSAVYSNKRTDYYWDEKADKDKTFSYTEKVTLPVMLSPLGETE